MQARALGKKLVVITGCIQVETAGARFGAEYNSSSTLGHGSGQAARYEEKKQSSQHGRYQFFSGSLIITEAKRYWLLNVSLPCCKNRDIVWDLSGGAAICRDRLPGPASPYPMQSSSHIDVL
jgi:hypothetical protein